MQYTPHDFPHAADNIRIVISSLLLATTRCIRNILSCDHKSHIVSHAYYICIRHTMPHHVYVIHYCIMLVTHQHTDIVCTLYTRCTYWNKALTAFSSFENPIISTSHVIHHDMQMEPMTWSHTISCIIRTSPYIYRCIIHSSYYDKHR